MSSFSCGAVTALAVIAMTAPQQSHSTSAINLRLVVDSVVVTPLKGSVFGKVRCDDKGNIYLRINDSERVRSNTLFQSPIQKLNNDGSVGGVFDAAETGVDLNILDFFVTAGGKVFEIAMSRKHSPQRYILRYSSGGSLEAKTEVQSDSFLPYQIAASDSGAILLSGTAGDGNHDSFTGLFDDSGKLIRKISPQDDKALRDRAALGDSELSTWGQGNLSIAYGDAVAASDGNLYLMRATSPAIIYAISPTGEVIRTLRVDPGTSGMLAASLKSDNGELIVGFRSNGKFLGSVFKVVDFLGDELLTLTSDDSRIHPSFLGCYNAREFVWYQTRPDGTGTLVKATGH